jgi:hypothetical protein
MATVALICQKISPQVLLTAKGLAEQKNEVLIITSFQEKPKEVLNVQVLSYFKKWSATEALKLIRKIFFRPPQVFHFFFHDENESATRAHWILLSFAESLNRATVVSLLGKKVRSQNWRFNPFLKFIRAVTVPTRERLMYLKRRNLIQKNKLTEVILPLHQDLPEVSAQNDDLETFLNSIQPFLFVPAPPRLDYLEFLNESLGGSPFRVLFLGARTKNLSQFKRFFSISDDQINHLSWIIKKSSAVLLAHHEFAINELMMWQSMSQTHGTPLIVKAQQTEMLPGLCLHEKNGFVLESNKWAFKFLLQKRSDLSISNFLKNQENLPSTDQSLNELSRLYVKASHVDREHSTN